MRKRSFVFLLGVLSVALMAAACVPIPEPAGGTGSQPATGVVTVPPPATAVAATVQATTVPTSTGEVASTAEVSTSLPPSTSLPLTATVAVTTTVPPAAVGTPDQGQRITLDDNGKTVTLKVGERVLLYLGEDYTWDVAIVDQSVISRVIGVMVIRGAQGLFEARQPGTTTLTANGDPPCRQSQPPCMAPSRAFQVTIKVQPAS